MVSGWVLSLRLQGNKQGGDSASSNWKTSTFTLKMSSIWIKSFRVTPSNVDRDWLYFHWPKSSFVGVCRLWIEAPFLKREAAKKTQVVCVDKVMFFYPSQERKRRGSCWWSQGGQKNSILWENRAGGWCRNWWRWQSEHPTWSRVDVVWRVQQCQFLAGLIGNSRSHFD